MYEAWKRLSLSGLIYWVALGWLCTASAALAAGPDIRGRVELQVSGVSLAQVGPVVVYLEMLDGQAEKPATDPATMLQRNARFRPTFLIVMRGQAVEMPNFDAIYHNVFSFSRPNDFDLGLYPAGESRSIVFEHAGVVKMYCSIHENMNAPIFVAPGPHYTLIDPDGRFVLKDVPPGRYRLSTWCERLPSTTREVTVEAGRGVEVEIQLATLSS